MTKSYKAVDTLAPPNQNPGYATGLIYALHNELKCVTLHSWYLKGCWQQANDPLELRRVQGHQAHDDVLRSLYDSEHLRRGEDGGSL